MTMSSKSAEMFASHLREVSDPWSEYCFEHICCQVIPDEYFYHCGRAVLGGPDRSRMSVMLSYLDYIACF